MPPLLFQRLTKIPTGKTAGIHFAFNSPTKIEINPNIFHLFCFFFFLVVIVSCSNFSDIFDVDWFISYLSKDVKIIKELPAEGSKYINPYRTRVPRKCNPQCYKTRILPLLKKKHVSVFALILVQMNFFLLSCLRIV